MLTRNVRKHQFVQLEHTRLPGIHLIRRVPPTRSAAVAPENDSGRKGR